MYETDTKQELKQELIHFGKLGKRGKRNRYDREYAENVPIGSIVTSCNIHTAVIQHFRPSVTVDKMFTILFGFFML